MGQTTSIAFAVIALLTLAWPARASANAAAEANAEQPTGRLLRVPLPLTGDVDSRVRTMIRRFATSVKRGGERPVLVLEFSPAQGSDAGRGSEFGRCHDLASYLTGPDLSGIKTVAYLPKSVKGHAVLVAMACEEIVMSPDAELGDAGIDERRIGASTRTAYLEVAKARKTIPEQLALAMLDKNHQAYKVVTEGAGAGTQYVDDAGYEELKKTKTITEKTPIRKPAIFSANDARNVYGFASFLAKDREELTKALKLPEGELRQDPSLEREWVAVQIPIDQPIGSENVNRILRLIDDQIRGDVNFICLRINSGGGSIADSVRLATRLAELDPGKVTTVAYIPDKALADASLIALACDQVFMLPKATLGGAAEGQLDDHVVQQQIQSFRSKVLKEKARQTGRAPRSWSLPAALVDRNVDVFEYKNAVRGLTDYFSDEELKAQDKPDQWQQGRRIGEGRGPLTLKGNDAEEFGLITSVVNNFDELKERFGLEDNPTLVEPGWAHSLIEALASESFSMLLLMIGVAAIYAELNTPGLGIGAFVALVCFLLYFWAKHLHGTAGWLEVLLFLGGMICIVLEVFVIPGFGIFGLGGGAMVIASLVLASQTFVLPRNDYQFEQLRTSLLTLVGAGIGTFAAIMVIRRVLPHTPMFNRMVLAPPSGEELQDLSDRESLVDLRHLLGREGRTTTPLMPSGKARFGDELVNVIAAGEAIDRDAPVVVVEVRGNRVLVQDSRAVV